MSNFSKAPKSIRTLVFSGEPFAATYLPKGQAVFLADGRIKTTTKEGIFLFKLIFCKVKHDPLGAAATWVCEGKADSISLDEDNFKAWAAAVYEIRKKCSAEVGAAKRAAQGLPPCPPSPR